jgi:hypothetical protein
LTSDTVRKTALRAPEDVSQNGHKKQQNEQEKKNLGNPNGSDRHMSKTQHNSEKSSNENGNKPEQTIPPDWIVEDTLSDAMIQVEQRSTAI